MFISIPFYFTTTMGIFQETERKFPILEHKNIAAAELVAAISHTHRFRVFPLSSL
jgi:hypothetical protein